MLRGRLAESQCSVLLIHAQGTHTVTACVANTEWRSPSWACTVTLPTSLLHVSYPLPGSSGVGAVASANKKQSNMQTNTHAQFFLHTGRNATICRRECVYVRTCVCVHVRVFIQLTHGLRPTQTQWSPRCAPEALQQERRDRPAGRGSTSNAAPIKLQDVVKRAALVLQPSGERGGGGAGPRRQH
jgi:hypothetical protein